MSRILFSISVDNVNLTGFKILILFVSRINNKISIAAYQSSASSIKGIFQVDHALYGLSATGRSCLFGLSRIKLQRTTSVLDPPTVLFSFKKFQIVMSTSKA